MSADREDRDLAGGVASSLLSDELRVLARAHPRAGWPGHPNLGEVARFWLERHAMFRELDRVIREGGERVLAGADDPAAFRPWLARHLRLFLWQLEEHHQVEDLHYFPLFSRFEPRLAAGFALLERDHAALHTALEALAGRANRVLVVPGANAAAFRTDLGRFLEAGAGLGRELGRHLDDEEDLVIPLILEHGERRLFEGG